MTITLNSEVTVRSEALSYLSDCYKDAHGVRPMLSSYDHMSIEEINAECDELNAKVYDDMIREEIQAENDACTFQFLIEKTIKLGASDEKTALKWLWDGYIGDYSVEVNSVSVDQFLWYYGILSSSYGNKIHSTILNVLGNKS